MSHRLPSKKHEDLESVNPEGRVDVIAYKLSKILVEKLEGKIGVQLWDKVKNPIQEVITDNIPKDMVGSEFKEIQAILGYLKSKGVGVDI